MPLEPAEKKLDRPAFFVNIHDCLGTGFPVRGDEVEYFFGQTVPINDVTKSDLGVFCGY